VQQPNDYEKTKKVRTFGDLYFTKFSEKSVTQTSAYK
jgi:hypothetical protein